MRPTKAIHSGLMLLGSAILLVGLNLLDSPRPPPHSASFLAGLRLLIGMPVLLFVPSFFVVPYLFRRDISTSSDSNAVDPIWFLLSAGGLNLLFHFLNFNALRLAGLSIDWRSLSLVMIVEAIIGLAVLKKSFPELSFTVPSLGEQAAVATATLAMVAFAFWQAPHLLTDSSWYFDNDTLNQELEPSHHPGAIEIQLRPDREFPQGRAFQPSSPVETLIINNQAELAQDVPLYFLVHSRIGAGAQLIVHSNSGKTPGISPPSKTGKKHRIKQSAPVHGDIVERYWEWGTVLMTMIVRVPADGSTAVDLKFLPAREGDAGPDLEEFQVIAMANLTGAEVRGEFQELGIHSLHPYQMLNVTENVRWAAEVASTHVLPGHSPPWISPPSTLHQPPAWTYLYAPARELLTPQLISASVLLVLTLFALLLGAIKGLEGSPGMTDYRVAVLLAAALSFNAAQHGRLMVSDGSMNFPDNLFACALVLAVVSLCRGKSHIFVLWAMLAAVLRYPGAVVVLLSGLALVAVDRQRRVQVIEGLMKFGLVIALFCAAMLAAGIATGVLPSWLYSLYFETIPEHFRNSGGDALPMLLRPVHFLRIWLLVGGGLLLLAAPFRGKLSRVAAITALLYFPFLGFIDHHSHHYFLPLIGLAGISACASIAQDPRTGRRLLLSGLLAALAAGLFLYAKIHSL